ncbi:cytochrome P450 6a22-like [Anopheles albimanus]|uniref:cytochrome P450 6a22-like n=1 Tax=Anopheles albimanus TaxID=7167 RepID=UPI0016412905|nr:cytochrome P450 6a22-like [Anopheles albimanus]
MVAWLWTLFLGAFGSASLLLCFAFLRRRRSFWLRHDIPTTSEPAHLLYGNVRGISTEHHTATILQRLYREFRTRNLVAGGFNLFFSPVLLVIDPDLIERVLVSDFSKFRDRGVYANATVNPLTSRTLFSLAGEQWQHLRQVLAPAHATVNIRALFAATVRNAQGLVSFVGTSVGQGLDSLEWTDLTARYTTDAIGSCIGIDCRAIREPHRAEFRTMGHRAFRFSVRRMWKLRFGYTFRRLADALRLCVNESIVERFFLQLCRSTGLHRESYRTVKRDFLQILLEMKERGLLDMTQVAAQCYQLFIAGFETSATLLNFALYELARDASVQKRLRSAIQRALDETDGQLNYDMVMSLDYLDQIIKETLRMYPPVDFLFRVSNVDYTIHGVGTVPRGTLFVVPVHAIHHDAKYYPQPEQFNPDRFSAAQRRRVKNSFLPFGLGPRHCIGEEFALMLVKVGLVALVRAFRFSLDTNRMPASGEPIVFKPRSLVLAPIGGMYLRVERI